MQLPGSLRSCALLCVIGSAACDGGSPPADGAVGVDAAPGVDAALGLDARPPTGCVVVVAASGAACAADCEAHLFLPSGMAYCTLTCGVDGDCAPYGAELTCAAEVGTCMPRCADDAGCTLADAVAVGDWVNDVPMFAVAGRSFAMGGAPDAVAATATDQLTRPAGAGGGIAEAIRRAWG